MKKIIVVTGVGKGFGRALFKSLLNQYSVIGITRDANDIDSLREEIARYSGEFQLIQEDVSNFDIIAKSVTSAINSMEGMPYGLINNAGVRCRKSIDLLAINDFIEVCNVNLFGAINLTNALLPMLRENRQGRIINISSILSQGALPELSAYAVSKGGLDAFTRSAAVELGDQNITVNSILPGFCKTSYFSKFSQNSELLNMTLDRTPMKRWGDDDELIGLCDFLLSENASYITGTSIPIDGGWLAQ